ncbi:hypothetical protein ES703_83901 [subsurface metagenome]
MAERNGKRVSDCPIGLEYCYRSCYFWREIGCYYPDFMNELEKERSGKRPAPPPWEDGNH